MNRSSIEQLSNLHSSSGGTSLVTYCLQGNTNIWLATQKLNEELSTASNIRNKNVRKDVEQALRQLLHQLKNYRLQKVPENGLVLCAGSVIENKQCV